MLSYTFLRLSASFSYELTNILRRERTLSSFPIKNIRKIVRYFIKRSLSWQLKRSSDRAAAPCLNGVIRNGLHYNPKSSISYHNSQWREESWCLLYMVSLLHMHISIGHVISYGPQQWNGTVRKYRAQTISLLQHRRISVVAVAGTHTCQAEHG